MQNERLRYENEHSPSAVFGRSSLDCRLRYFAGGDDDELGFTIQIASAPDRWTRPITNGNAAGGVVTNYIYFNITTNGLAPFIIRPTNALTSILSPVVIDGYTQTNATPNTLTNGNNANIPIVLNGNLAGANADGLFIAANSVTIRGLVINGFSRAAIRKPASAGSASTQSRLKAVSSERIPAAS